MSLCACRGGAVVQFALQERHGGRQLHASAPFGAVRLLISNVPRHLGSSMASKLGEVGITHHRQEWGGGSSKGRERSASIITVRGLPVRHVCCVRALTSAEAPWSGGWQHVVDSGPHPGAQRHGLAAGS